MLRLPIAMSLFGLKQVENLLVAPDGSRAASAFATVTRALEGELGSGWMERLFDTGDRLQRQAVDRLFDLAPGVPEAPRRVGATALRLLRRSAAATARVAPIGGEVWRELGNKLEAFENFQQVERDGRATALGERLRRAAAGEPWVGLWAREGLGYAHAEASWSPERADHGLLSGRDAGDLPRESLIAVHTGIGLVFAERLLDGLPAVVSEARLDEALDRCVRLCRGHARRGYEEVAFESLGLVTRTLHPHLLARVDRCLERRDPLLAELFWHGVGRALYFTPSNVLPRLDGGWRAVDEALAERADRRGQLLAGLVWALTLVNLRDPAVLERFLHLHADEIEDLDPLRQGVASALLVWRDAVGDDEHLRRFLEHAPGPPSGTAARRWTELVERPGRAALDRVYPALSSARRLGTLFRYRPCDRWLRHPADARRPASLRRGAEEPS